MHVRVFFLHPTIRSSRGLTTRRTRSSVVVVGCRRRSTVASSSDTNERTNVGLVFWFIFLKFSIFVTKIHNLGVHTRICVRSFVTFWTLLSDAHCLATATTTTTTTTGLDSCATKRFYILYSSSSSSWDAWGTCGVDGVVVVVERFGAPQE